MLTNMQIKVFVIVYDDKTNIRLVHTRMSLLNSILIVTGFAIDTPSLLKIKFGTRQKKDYKMGSNNAYTKQSKKLFFFPPFYQF